MRAATLSDVQADAIAAAIGKAVSESATTKADLGTLEHRVAADIEALEQRLLAKLEAFRSSMLLWFIGTQVAVGGLIVTLVKL